MNGLIHRLRFRRDHRWAQRQMSAYLDQQLPPRPRARIDRHLGECRECRRLLRGLTRVLAGLHQLPRPATVDTGRLAASVRARLSTPPV